MKVKFHYNYPVSLDIDCNKPVDVFIDQFTMEPVVYGSLRIVILQEPWKSPMVPLVQTYRDKYTHLLTYQEEVLDTNPKARLFHFPSSWIDSHYEIKEKEFSVSTVVGGKNMAQLEGHQLRHDLWHNQHKIAVPKNFWLSGSEKHSHVFVPWTEVNYLGRRVLGVSKEPLFTSMFHIAIENTSIANFFTEKLLDCFRTGVVPIYYGCTNIGDYFNLNGIIVVRNLNEMINACNLLTPDVYKDMAHATLDNYVRSSAWCDQQGQLRAGIEKILKEENA